MQHEKLIQEQSGCTFQPKPMSRQSKEMCKGLKPWQVRQCEHLERKKQFIDLKKREIQRQILEEC